MKHNSYKLRLFAFVLLNKPIPFLLGLQNQQHLGVDICLRKVHASHLNITKWQSMHLLTVSLHLWLRFEPIDSVNPRSQDFREIISSALTRNSSLSHHLFSVLI